MNMPCIKCKGKDPKKNCGRDFCPIIAKSETMFKVRPLLPGKDFATSSPAPFIGRAGYPFVNVGILAPSTGRDAWKYDAPRFWAEQNLGIKQVIDYRSLLINSRFKADIRNQNKLLQISQEIGMASRPVDIEIHLKDKPMFRVRNNDMLPPMGPNASLEKADITSNPFVSSKVEKVVSDSDWKANDALAYLHKKGFDENFLTKLLSVGNVGIKTNRKLVPTRWAITATDDLLAKNLMGEVKCCNQVNSHLAFFGGYLGNYYIVMLFPDIWSYELFETYLPKAEWNTGDEIQYATDCEFYDSRKEYASNTAGGYYAARLPVLEKLKELKHQASVLVLRFITGEYAAPLGVWVCREAVRKALNSKPIEFYDRSYMLNYARLLVKKKFGCSADKLLKKSKLLDKIIAQHKLSAYLKQKP